MTNNKQLGKEIDFLKVAEGLKRELRHSWLSDQRQESVAEHSWRLALMSWRYADKLDQIVNLEICFKMAIIHDLAEAIEGDIPCFDCHTHKDKKEKFARELSAMQSIQRLLDDPHGNELHSLWLEYENQQSYESRYIRALDKLEAFIQHNEAPLETWQGNEKRMVFQYKWLRQHCEFDSFLTKLAELVLLQAKQKLIAAGENPEQLHQEAQMEEESWSN